MFSSTTLDRYICGDWSFNVSTRNVTILLSTILLCNNKIIITWSCEKYSRRPTHDFVDGTKIATVLSKSPILW